MLIYYTLYVNIKKAGMTERQKAILLTLVKEYIKHGQPIGSKYIFERYNFNISPATFRNEFATLERFGYLYQPYTSAGRAPTDKGYRFFVNYLLEKRRLEQERTRKILEELIRVRKREEQLLYNLAKTIADFSNSAVMIGSLNKGLFFKSGIHRILSMPEFDDLNFRKKFGSLVDFLEDNIFEIVNKSENDLSVYIGKELPYRYYDDFSLILSRCSIVGNDKNIIALIGPKRMDYSKGINIIKILRKLV